MTDFYKGCVAEVLGLPEEAVTDHQRELAKRLSFSARYATPFARKLSDEEMRREVIGVLSVARHLLANQGAER